MTETIEVIVGIDDDIDYSNLESTSQPWTETIVSE
jgi:hypothetical protein